MTVHTLSYRVSDFPLILPRKSLIHDVAASYVVRNWELEALVYVSIAGLTVKRAGND